MVRSGGVFEILFRFFGFNKEVGLFWGLEVIIEAKCGENRGCEGRWGGFRIYGCGFFIFELAVFF